MPVGATLTAATALVAGLLAGWWSVDAALADIERLAMDAFGRAPARPDLPGLRAMGVGALQAVMECVAPVALAAWAAAFATHNLQTQFLFASLQRGGEGPGVERRVRPRIGPPSGAPLIAAASLGALTFLSIRSLLRVAASGDVWAGVGAALATTSRFALGAVAFGFLFGLAAAAYERWRFERAIRMTRWEWLRELRETEGHPVTRRRRARARTRG